MRPRLAAALASLAALAAVAVFTTAAVKSGPAEPPPASAQATPVTRSASFDEIEEAINKLVEAVRHLAQQQAAAQKATEPRSLSIPDQPSTPGSATPEATPVPSQPVPEDASADPDCVTKRESRPGVLMTSVRCQHQNVTQDGSSSSVVVSSSSSISVSSSSTTTP